MLNRLDMASSRPLHRRPLVWAILLIPALVLATVLVWVRWMAPALLVIDHAPTKVDRRSGSLSANICGRAMPGAKLRYRLNGGAWQEVPRGGPRIVADGFTIEVLPQALNAGENGLDIESSALARPSAQQSLKFHYDPAPVTLPKTVDWRQPLQVQDGHWQVFEDETEKRVGPKPGAAGYDRLLLAAGSFAEPRRVETEVVFRSFVPNVSSAGFGVLTLWGGHFDEGALPRRGWKYALAWYSTAFGSVCEFSIKQGSRPRHDSFSAVNQAKPAAGTRYRIIAECKRDEHGLRQRMKMWSVEQPEPKRWIKCADLGKAQLPKGEYGVALVAHNCVVEFGAVRILPLPANSDW